MADFTTRVELHDADSDDYEKLHAAMERRGFTRWIQSDDGVKYDLPTAEYNFEGDKTRKEVLALAKEAAGTTNLRYGIIVTEANGRTWSGLPKR